MMACAEAEADLVVGEAVKLHSLQSSPEHNDALGELHEYDASTGRWAVKLVLSGRVVALRPGNLTRITELHKGIGSIAEGNVDKLLEFAQAGDWQSIVSLERSALDMASKDRSKSPPVSAKIYGLLGMAFQNLKRDMRAIELYERQRQIEIEQGNLVGELRFVCISLCV